jgi:hypothetical protein
MDSITKENPMKKIIIGLVALFVLINLIGCSKKEDLPYALPGNQYKIIYVTSDDVPGDEYNGKNHFWLIEYGENEGRDFSIIVNGLKGIQDIAPTLKAEQAPFVYILSSEEMVLETSDFEEAKKFLIEIAK